MEGRRLRSQLWKCSSDDIGVDNWVCGDGEGGSLSIDIPEGGGTVLMAGSAEVQNTGSSGSVGFTCWFRWGYSGFVPVDSSIRHLDLEPGERGICSSTAWKELSAGPMDLDFNVYFDSFATADLVEGSAWFLFIPN
jgi:hypothetical protein